MYICRIQNPDIPRAGMSGAAHGGAGGRGGERQDRTPAGRFAKETTVPFALQSIEDKLSWTILRKHE